MPTDAPYSISDLARLTGLSVRTIRYYLAQGLIPASGESGPGAHYGDGHLGRLRLIRRLQQQHLPLAEIRARLASLSDADVAAIAATDVEPPTPSTSALDYVRSVLAGSHQTVPTAQLSAPPPMSPMSPTPPMVAEEAMAAAPITAAPMAAMPPMRDTPPAAGRLLRRMVPRFATDLREAAAGPALPLATAKNPASLEAATEAGAAEAQPAPHSIERSQWERLSLGLNLELHVRRPLGRLEQKRVERLITIARQVLKEEQP